MKSNVTPRILDEKEFADELAPGAVLLHGQYVIEAHLNSGGFGITYLAKDSLHRRVVIKECFPGAFCRRSKMIVGVRTRAHAKEFRTIVDLFVAEARQLARLRHPNIVGVHQVFLDNDTAYMALDFVDGRDLLELLEDPAVRLSPRNIQEMTVKLLDAIEFIHGQGILHRDISPDNILLSKNMEPVLIDFGAARETATRATRHLGAMRTVKDGYSPQEFYLSDAAQYPSSDLYSLGASLYHLMTGETPPNAQERLTAVASGDADPYLPIAERVGEGFSPSFLEAIDKALNIFPKHRIQTAADWRAMITHTRATSATRGSVSRPMLAVDNGNVVAHIQDLVRDEQLATEQDLQDAGLSGEPVRKRPVRKIRTEADKRPTHAEAPADKAETTAREDSQRLAAMRPEEKSARPVGLVAGLLLLVAAAGGAAYFTLSGAEGDVDKLAAVETAAGKPPAAAADGPGPDEVAAAPGPVMEAAGRVDTEIAVPAAEPSGDAPVIATPDRVALEAGKQPPQRPATVKPDAAVAAPAEPNAAAFAPDVKADVDNLPILAGEANGVELTGDGDLSGFRRAPVVASAPKIGERPTVDLASAAPVERAEPADVIDVSSVISGPAVSFPFEVDATDPTLIVAVTEGTPDFLEPGFRVVSINGFPVDNFADAQQIVKATRDFRIGDEVRITLGVDDTRSGNALVRSMTLPTVQETFLLNGVRFRTRLADGKWTTTVVEAPNRGANSLRTGDEMVAFMPASEMIDRPTSLARIINRELAAKVTKFNFAVRRHGEMYLVSMNYGGAGN